jgi:SAM-dependent methyltransferase
VNERETVGWSEDGEERCALWRSGSGARPPKRLRAVDDRLPADAAYKLACEGTALLWRGDFHGARQLLSALGRRVDRKPAKSGASPREDFHLRRQALSRRARVLGMLLVPLRVTEDGEYTVPLRRAPDVHEACASAYGPAYGPAFGQGPGPWGPGPLGPGAGPAREAEDEAKVPACGGSSLVALRELLGVIGAHEWERSGVPVAALGGDRVHPTYGVFAPVRDEYVDLVAQAPLPAGLPAGLAADSLAYDIGTGTGVLSAVLARRGIARIVATDQEPRALDCARANLRRLGLSERTEVTKADLFPPGDAPAPLIVCNPPWLPAKPTSPLEHAVYDPGSRMLRGFLAGLAARLTRDGEGWLVLSDLAEHLQLRTRPELIGWIEEAGLRVVGREETRPRHPRAADPADPLHAARAAEATSLWRLARAA